MQNYFHYLGEKNDWSCSKCRCKNTLRVDQTAVWTVHLNKRMGFPPQNMKLAITLPFKKLKTTAISCVYVYDIGTGLSATLLFSIPSNTKFSVPHRIRFIETVLVICILAQKSNPRTLIIFASNNYYNLHRETVSPAAQ